MLEPTSQGTEASLSDEALLQAFREAAGDGRRLLADQLFARHYETVARWCYRFTGERESAADLAQEVFLKAHRHLATFQGNSQFRTWLYSIARNEAINFSRRRAPQQESDEVLAEVPALDPNPEQQAAEKSRTRRLHEFMATTLEETERIVFTLHYGEELPLDVITRTLQLSNSSGAKAYIVSARRKLARAVEKMFARGGEL